MSTQQSRIVRTLSEGIMDDRYPVGSCLPAVAVLAKQTRCSPHAVRRALRLLSDRGVLRSVKKKGTCVLRRPAAGQVLLMLAPDIHTNALLQEPVVRALIGAGFEVDLQPFLFSESAVGFEAVRQRLLQHAEDTVLLALAPNTIAPGMQAEWRQFLAQFGARVSFQFEEASPLPGVIILPDPAAAARVVAEHLLQMGHRRIGVVAGGGPGDGSSSDRRAAFLSEILGVVRAECHPFTYNLHANEGVVSFIRRTGCTAWWAITDHQALEHIHLIQEAGLRVPEDVSVVGSNDTPWATMGPLPLTTVSLNPEAIAGALVEAVREVEATESPLSRRQYIRPLLIPRASTAAPGCNT